MKPEVGLISWSVVVNLHRSAEGDVIKVCFKKTACIS